MNDLEEQLTNALDRRGAQVVVDDRLAHFAVEPDGNADDGHDVDGRRSVARTRWFQPRLLAAVAAVGLVVVGVLAVAQLGGRSAGDLSLDGGESGERDVVSVVTPPTVPPTPFASVDAIGVDDWVVPRVLPGGVEFLYAIEYEGFDDSSRTVHYGVDASMEGLMTVGISEFPPQPGDERYTVDGTEWRISRVAGSPIAGRQVGSLHVSVAGGFVDDDEMIEVLAGLEVIGTDELPFAPVGFAAEMTDVGVFTNDGREFILSATESGGWYCTSLRTSGFASGACATFFDPADHLQAEHGRGSTFGGTSPYEKPYVEGRASAETARVEVEWRDGTVSTVEPQNTSDRFPDVRFWATDMSVDFEDDRFPEDLVEVRAFAADGSLLATSIDGRVVVER